MLRAKAGYLVFLILMGTLALLYNTRFTFLLFLTCLALPVALLVLLAAAWPFVRIRGIAAPYTAEKGGRFPVEFEAQNRSLFPLPRVDVYLWYRNEFSEKKRRERISISLAGKGDRRIRLFYTSDYCGRLTIQIDKVRIYDYLGICSLSKRPGKSIPVAVLPDRKGFGDLVVSENYTVYSEFDIAAASRPGDDPSEILEIREYLPGDRLNRIHWKRSTMTDGLFVKEFGDTSADVSLVIIDLKPASEGERGLAQMDRILEAAFSLSERLRQQGRLHFLAWYDERHERADREWMDSEEAFYDAVGRIYECSFCRGKVLSPLLITAAWPKEHYARIFCVCAQEQAAGLEEWALSLRPSDCLIVPVGSGEETAERLISEGAGGR